jgi:flagellar motor component MotA
MSLIELRDEFKSSNAPATGLLGSVMGIILILGPVTGAIVLIGKWSRSIGLALSSTVIVGTFLTVIEVVQAVLMWRAPADEASVAAMRYVLLVKIIELGLFVGALAALYRFLLKMP